MTTTKKSTKSREAQAVPSPAQTKTVHHSGKKVNMPPATPGLVNHPADKKPVEAQKVPEVKAPAKPVVAKPAPKPAEKLNYKSLPTGKTVDHGYGVSSAPIYFTKKDDNVEPSRYQEIRRDGRLVAIATKKYTVIPNELVIELVKEAGIKDFKEEYDRDGNAIYIQIVNEKMENAVKAGDVVRLGTIVSNSIDTSEALAAKTFTYRLACGNGAIGPAKMMGSLFLRHIGERKKLVDMFRQSIDVAMAESMRLVEMYRRSLKVSVDQRIAQAIVDVGFAREYLPTNIDYTTDPKTHKRTAVLKEKGVDLWETFNGMTKPIWHGQNISMAGKVARTQDLHKIMAEAVTTVAA